jgi:hypothetical protein
LPGYRRSSFHRQPLPDLLARRFGKVYEAYADFFGGLVSPGDAAFGFKVAPKLRHLKIDVNILAGGLKAEKIQRDAAFADVVQYPVAAGTAQ